MILMFAWIAAGIAIGMVGMLIVVAAIRWQDEQPPEGDLADLIYDIEPVDTPFTSEIIRRHREAHLSAREGGE